MYNNYVLVAHHWTKRNPEFFNIFMIYTAPDDYAGGTYIVVFSAGSKTAQLQIPVVNDTDVEKEEDFFGSIFTSASSGLRLGPKLMATVSIQDDDSK